MNSLGVVDPIVLPAPVGRWIGAVPRAAWLFFGVASLVVFADTRNAVGPDLASDVGQIVVVGAAIGLLIALPGIALIRSPSVPTLAPIAYRGLVLIAIGTIVSKVVSAVFGSEFGAAADAGLVANIAQALIYASGSIVAALGWLALARALARRNVVASSRVTALAAVAAAAIVGMVFTGLGSTVSNATAGTSDPSFVWFAGIGSAAHVVIGLSWTALVWTFIRTMSSNRSGAAFAAGLWSIAVAIGAGLSFASSGILSLAPIEANQGLWSAIGTVFTMVPAILLATAVALGLLDRRDAVPTGEPTASA